MWLFGVAAVSSVILIVVIWRVAMERHRKRQNRAMRDHLNRISQTFD
jgi:hypothetical protein